MRTRDLVRADIYRYTGKKKNSILGILRTLYYEPALYSIIYFRWGQRIEKIKIPLFKVLLKVFFIWIIKKITDTVLCIEISSNAQIGPGLYIGHYGNIFIGPTKIGNNCNISQEVTIGIGGQGTEKEGIPTIGDSVYIAPGAKLFGKIKIGDNVSIGANAVVSKDIPYNVIVMGNPGRAVRKQNENPYIQNEFIRESK